MLKINIKFKWSVLFSTLPVPNISPYLLLLCIVSLLTTIVNKHIPIPPCGLELWGHSSLRLLADWPLMYGM